MPRDLSEIAGWANDIAMLAADLNVLDVGGIRVLTTRGELPRSVADEVLPEVRRVLRRRLNDLLNRG